ncbi:MAG: hypothetical protein H6573_25670 [Lewinellaceae bacterium]|nr:hypothetical protein [Phaeodactylibacter sp.]MCB9350866.1 hypothetical protein [Lewinellaceae bacterium]
MKQIARLLLIYFISFGSGSASHRNGVYTLAEALGPDSMNIAKYTVN